MQNEHHHQPSHTYTSITTQVTVYSAFMVKKKKKILGPFPCVILYGVLLVVFYSTPGSA